MALIIGTNFLGSGVVTALGSGDDYLLPAGTVIFSTSAGGIVVTGNDPDQTLTINGSISAGINGIFLNSIATTKLSVIVGDTGSIAGSNDGIQSPHKVFIDNHGIINARTYGIRSVGGGTVTNSGVIGGNFGIYEESTIRSWHRCPSKTRCPWP